MKNQLLPATLLICILAVANFACEFEKPQPNVSQSSADAISQEERSFSVLSSQFVLSKIETPELARNFFAKEGFTQIPVTENVYWLAGLHDKRAGKPYVEHVSGNCIDYAFVKKTALGVGLIIADFPCSKNGIKIKFDRPGSISYFFSNSDLEAPALDELNKCDSGNSVVLDSYQHSMYYGNGRELIGVDKTVSMVQLCYDGVWVSKGSTNF